MVPIQSLTSDLEHEYEFIKSVKRRIVEQKFLYSDENAFKYYQSIDQSFDFDESNAAFEDFIESIYKTLGNKKNALVISLGCGDARKEVNLIKSLNKRGADYSLLAIDSSKQMLEFAYKNLKNSGIKFELIHSDMTAISFQSEIQNLIKSYDTCVFTLLGCTLGNMVQTEIVDTLYNMASEGSYVLVDCVARPGNEKIDQLRLFKEYVKRLDDPREIEFYCHPLDKLQIPRENGVMQMQSIVEDSIGAQKFRFGFRVQKPTTIIYRGQTLHFLPPESIKLLDIRIYHSPTLISFFEKHKLSLLKDFYKDSLGIFQFQKQD